MLASFSLMAVGEYGPTMVSEHPDVVRSRLADVKRILAANNLAFPPGSRFARFESLQDLFANRLISPAYGKSSVLDDLLEGTRDFKELALIVEQLVAPGSSSIVLKKVHDVLGGAPRSRDDTNSLARDTQFELYVAALCQYAGIPVEVREPDIIIKPAGVRLGVAAKRVKSARKVRERVHEGGAQLKRAGLVGIVALNLDELVPLNDQRLFRDSAEELKPTPRELVNAMVNSQRKAIAIGAASSPVLAVRVSVVAVGAIPTENLIGRVSGNYLVGITRPTRLQHKALLYLVKAFARSVPT